MTRWFQSLDSAWKAVVVIGAAVLSGVTVTLTAYAYVGLPEAVQKNADNIGALTERLEKVEISQKDILDAIRFSNCMALAEARGEPWQGCER